MQSPAAAPDDRSCWLPSAASSCGLQPTWQRGKQPGRRIPGGAGREGSGDFPASFQFKPPLTLSQASFEGHLYLWGSRSRLTVHPIVAKLEVLIRPRHTLSRRQGQGRGTGAKVHLGCTETEFTDNFLTGAYNFSAVDNV